MSSNNVFFLANVDETSQKQVGLEESLVSREFRGTALFFFFDGAGESYKNSCD